MVTPDFLTGPQQFHLILFNRDSMIICGAFMGGVVEVLERKRQV
jgi:hypothetical protein